jgi:sulfur carrier protein ThiS
VKLYFIKHKKPFLERKRVMELKVKILAEKEEERRLEVSNDATYEYVLEKLGINPVEVVVLRNSKPVPEDEKVDTLNNGAVTIIRIVSGG